MSTENGPLHQWVTVGRVLRSHGVDGTVRASLDDVAIAALTAALADARHGDTNDDAPPKGGCVSALQLIAASGRRLTCTLQACRPVHGAVLLRLRQIGSREAAHAWHGADIVMPAQALPPPSSGEAYLHELVGAHVVDVAGKPLGIVAAATDNAGQILLRLAPAPDAPFPPGSDERLLPLVPQTLEHIDRAHAGRAHTRLVVRVPEGLWEHA